MTVASLIDHESLSAATFPEQMHVELRFDDVDAEGQIDTVAIAGLFQDARRRFNMSRLPELLGDQRDIVVASLSIRQMGAVRYPHPVEISTGVMEIGRSSFVLAQRASQAGIVAAAAEVTLVARDRQMAASLPAEVRSALERARIVPA